jgi:hypothetical protein
MLLFNPVCYTYAIEESATQKQVMDIVDVLVKDGKVRKDCVDAQPERDKIVKVALIRLTKSKHRQFLVEGRAPCAFGARDPMWYVFDKLAGEYRLIADLGAAKSVNVSKDMTNGWKDLVCNYTYDVGTRLAANIFIFNGTIYVYSHTVEKGKAPGI